MKALSCLVIALSFTLPYVGKCEMIKEKNHYDGVLNDLYVNQIHHIYHASVKAGVEMAEVAAFLKIESTFNPQAYNNKVGASGLFQHIATTWTLHKKLYAKKMGIPDWANVFTPKASIYIGTAAIAGDRYKIAKYTHRDPKDVSSGEVYLAHLFGFRKAMKIIKAKPGTDITSLVKVDKTSGVQYFSKGKALTTRGFIEGINKKMEKEKKRFKAMSDHYFFKFTVTKICNIPAQVNKNNIMDIIPARTTMLFKMNDISL